MLNLDELVLLILAHFVSSVAVWLLYLQLAVLMSSTQFLALARWLNKMSHSSLILKTVLLPSHHESTLK